MADGPSPASLVGEDLDLGDRGGAGGSGETFTGEIDQPHPTTTDGAWETA